MNTTPFPRYACLFATVLLLSLVGCGGGGDDGITPAEAATLLLNQPAECFAVAAGRKTPADFDRNAEDIASVPMASVCAAWQAGALIPCDAAYMAMARPYATASQCNLTVTP